MMKLSWALVLGLCLSVGCDSEAPSGERPTKIAGEEVPSEKEVRKAAKSAGPEDCGTYYKLVAEYCQDAFYGDKKLSCHSAYVSADMAKRQKAGKLFKDPNGKVSASEIGDTNCAVNIKSLARKREKAKSIGKKNWGPKCSAYLKRIEGKCVNPVAEGKFGDGCGTKIMMAGNLRKKDDSEALCANLDAMLK